jgi:hypothetical protein
VSVGVSYCVTASNGRNIVKTVPDRPDADECCGVSVKPSKFTRVAARIRNPSEDSICDGLQSIYYRKAVRLRQRNADYMKDVDARRRRPL